LLSAAFVCIGAIEAKRKQQLQPALHQPASPLQASIPDTAAAIAAAAAVAAAAAAAVSTAIIIVQVRAARGATSAAAIAANIAAAGYDSDEEVYATAKALQQQAEAEGRGGDSDDDVKVREGSAWLPTCIVLSTYVCACCVKQAEVEGRAGQGTQMMMSKIREACAV
jgi:hypothetical protein